MFVFLRYVCFVWIFVSVCPRVCATYLTVGRRHLFTRAALHTIISSSDRTHLNSHLLSRHRIRLCVWQWKSICVSFAPILSVDCLFKSLIPISHTFSLPSSASRTLLFFGSTNIWKTTFFVHSSISCIVTTGTKMLYNPMPVVCASENQFSKTFNNKNFDTSAYVQPARKRRIFCEFQWCDCMVHATEDVMWMRCRARNVKLRLCKWQDDRCVSCSSFRQPRTKLTSATIEWAKMYLNVGHWCSNAMETTNEIGTNVALLVAETSM